MTNEEVCARLREPARSLGFANIAVANNDIGKALADLAEVCFAIAAVFEMLNRPEIASRLRDAVRTELQPASRSAPRLLSEDNGR